MSLSKITSDRMPASASGQYLRESTLNGILTHLSFLDMV
jgi:hypothetical protein